MKPLKLILLTLCLPCLIYSQNETTRFNAAVNLNHRNRQHEIDSLNTLIQKCTVDTCMFRILAGYFWKYAESDLNHVREIGELAYQTIKSSKNLYALSDGYDIKGFMLEKDLKYDSAYIFFNRALAISKKIDYKTRIAWSYFHLVTINKALNNTDSALKYMRLLYHFNIESKFYKSACRNLDEMANIFQSQNQTDSAKIYRDKIINDELKPLSEPKKLDAYIEIIYYYTGINNTKKILVYTNSALKLAEKTRNNKALTSIYFQIGDLFFNQRKNYEIALSYYKKVLEICNARDKYTKASALNMIGRVYFEEGNDSLALVYSLKGLEFSREIKFKHQVSEAYSNLGRIYKHQGKLPEAIKNFQKCFDTGCNKCPKIAFHNALIDIADSYLKLDNRNKALEYYNKSLGLAQEFESDKEKAISNLKMGNYYRKVGENQSEKYYLEAFQLAQKSKNIYVLKSVADTLSTFYSSKNNFRAAYQYLNLNRKLNDSIISIERQESLANLEMKFEFEKINKENHAKEILAKEEISRQKIIKNSALLIALLLGILGLVIFQSYRRKYRDNRLLTFQRDEIMEKNREIEVQIEKIVCQKNEIEIISKKLHESDQAKLRFFANISHELRTPLTLILSPLTKLMKGNFGEPAQHLYSLIHRNAGKLQSMINQLLDISKIDKDELVLNLQMHHFDKQIKVIAEMFQSIADEKNIDFRMTRSENSLCFAYDYERMEQILNNLLSNAFKFTPQNGKIEIDISTENELVTLKVRDNGIGIPKESLMKVFDRFYQTEATIKGHFEGSGIGLTLTKELVELHQGKISVDSESGNWTEFTVTLPMVQIENVTSEIETNFSENINLSELGSSTCVKGKHRETVLLVEDNHDLRAYLAQSISTKYNVLEAKNGREGIEIAKKEIPDIIISDVMMPDTDGYQLTSEIRKQLETSHIPIILLTAKSCRDSKIEGLEKGADDYINKPFDEEELMLKLRNIMNNRQKLQEKYKKQISPTPSTIETPSMDEQFIAKLVSIVEKDIANNNLDVDYLGNNIGISRQQLYRKLKAITGLSPVEFIRSIRIKRAAQLIKQKAASVSEIAFITGFENLSYFSKKFKEEIGQLPSEYAKSEN